MIPKKDKRITHRLFQFCTCLLLLTNKASAQLHAPNLPQNKNLVLAQELFMQGQYKNAETAAELFLLQPDALTNKTSHSQTDKVRYLLTASKLELDAKGAEATAVEYINSTSNPGYKQRAAFALAQMYFKKNMFSDAIHYYELADVANLNNEEIIDAKFELAYCYFNNSQFNQAEPLLASVRELGGKYYDAGNYYYGLLAYNKSNYSDALKSFNRIEHIQEYSNIVPYYIAEIHYFKGNKDRALQDALKLIRKPEKSFYHNELHLLAAQIYFEDKDYTEALPYFEFFYDNTDRIRKEDLYEMAYCYYKTSDWKNAIDNFKQLSETRDSLGQSSMYLLGDCYLKTDDKKSARNAYSICADMPFNRGQKEASLLLAAKLSYELGYNSDAIYYINLLLADFPTSANTDEAKTLLSDLLIRTSNYAEAYSALEDVTNHDESYRRVYQKVTYGYAMQQMQVNNTAFADSLLTMSIVQGNDLTYKNAATFWKADLAYGNGNYANTIKYGNAFIKNNTNRLWVKHLSPAATEQSMYITMGYAAMELTRYDEAQNYFAKARFNAEATDSVFIAGTILREADAVFMQKNYKKAISLYDQVIEANTADADYARYQKAVILGLTDNNKEKANILLGLINSRPVSRYANEARYELGLTYIEDNKYSAAINAMMPLTEAYEMRNMAPKAWMRIGFAYQQAGDAPKAIAAYKHIVLEYPSSDERSAALDALKSLYIQSGQPDGYAKLLEENDLGGVEENVLDSTYYATAEAQYAANNWSKAIVMFSDYLQKYPNGIFATKANYYKAESHFHQKEYKKALTGYDFVLKNAWSNFSENSARRAANIAFEQNDLQDAKRYYTELRNMAMSQENLHSAYGGLMMSSFKLNENDNALGYADTLLSMPGLDPAIADNARLIKANSLLKADNNDAALAVLKQLEHANNGAIAAEARYNIANILFQQNNLKEAEEAAGNTIQLSGGNDYWVIKSYILLADILVEQKDYFNAKATLQSIVKNSKIPELKSEANAKLKEVKKLENKNSKLSD